MSEKYLVYGANGGQGSAVVRALLARGRRVRVLSRDPARCAFRDDARVEVVTGELDDASSLRRASEGVTGVYLMIPLSFDYPRADRWGRNAIDAASDANVRLLVFNTSGLLLKEPVGLASFDGKLELRRYLAQARIPSITLGGTLFMGNLAAPWSAPGIVHRGVLAYPMPENQRVSWISWEQAAAYAVAAFERPDLGASKTALELGGPEPLTGIELAAALSRVLQKPISYFNLPLPQLAAGIDQAFGAPAGRELADNYAWLARPRERSPLDVDPTRARAELPVPEQRFEDWASKVPWAALAGAAQ